MQISATQLRAGMVLLHGGELYRVMSVAHITPGNKRGHMQTKLRNLRTGDQTEHRFRSADSVERVSLEQQPMEFLYSDGETYHFMNTETFEQIELRREELGDRAAYLTPNVRVEVELHDGKPIGVLLPKTIDLKVTETAPGLKSATVTGELKPATLETGLVVRVPGFVEEGELVRINTETGEYVSRAR